eukprot:11379416-Heterocapsa_arctica.AAC.1
MDNKPEQRVMGNAKQIQTQKIENCNKKANIKVHQIQEVKQRVDSGNVVTDMILFVQGKINNEKHIQTNNKIIRRTEKANQPKHNRIISKLSFKLP